jgi:hypothetical protein
MAINFTDFSKAPLTDAPGQDLFESVLKGYKMAKEPAKMEREAKEKELANSIKAKALSHADEEWELNKAYKQALTNKANRPASAVAKSLNPNGAVANAEYIWNKSHPKDIPLTPEQEIEHNKRLQDAFEAGLEHTKATTNRSNTLNETQHKRDSTQLVKKYDEIRDIDKGVFPGTNDPIPPEQQGMMKSSLLLSIVKDTTDPKTREKLINASNMNITLDSINPTYLTQYSGGPGKVDKLADSIVEGFGKDYQREVVKSTAAAKQLRLYLGDSIQPTAQEKLDSLMRPEAWNVSPQLAKENFEFMRDLFKRETDTLVRAATDPTLYTAAGNSRTTPPVKKVNWSQHPVIGGQ